MNLIQDRALIDSHAEAGGLSDTAGRHGLFADPEARLGHVMTAVAGYEDAAADPGHEGMGGVTPFRSDVGNTTAVGTVGNFTNQDINGILSGYAWTGGAITFSFPTAQSNYGTDYSPWGEPNSFSAMIATQQDVARYAFGLVSSYTNLVTTEITESDTTHATVRLAASNAPPTSWAAYPGSTKYAGDVWVGNIKADPAAKAGYAFDTIMHEIGHSLGLKHGQDDDGTHGVLPNEHNSTEWSTMSYHSYIGADLYYRNVEGSGNQTYMIDDIAALQYMYGANFNTNAGDTVYSWSRATGEMFIDGAGQGASSTNTIYESLWDGNGVDTYDLHTYATKLNVDLRPGEWSTFDSRQLADLDSGDLHKHFAYGNVANAHLYQNDVRSLIENVIGGSGKDKITGNVARNVLTGGAGNDSLYGLEGKDSLIGGAGKDKLDGGDGNDRLEGGNTGDKLTGGAGADVILGGAGADKMWGGADNDADTFVFASIAESNNDRILDLDEAHDLLDLSAIDANSKKAGDQAFTLVAALDGKAGEAALVLHGGRTDLQLDIDGDGHADATIAMDGDHTGFAGFVL